MFTCLLWFIPRSLTCIGWLLWQHLILYHISYIQTSSNNYISLCHCSHKASWHYRKARLVQPASERADAEGNSEEDLSGNWWGDLGLPIYRRQILLIRGTIPNYVKKSSAKSSATTGQSVHETKASAHLCFAEKCQQVHIPWCSARVSPGVPCSMSSTGTALQCYTFKYPISPQQ